MGLEQGTPHSRATLSPIAGASVFRRSSHREIGLLTRLELGYVLARLDDDTSTLMAKAVLAANYHGPNGAVLPEMNI